MFSSCLQRIWIQNLIFLALYFCVFEEICATDFNSILLVPTEKYYSV